MFKLPSEESYTTPPHPTFTSSSSTTIIFGCRRGKVRLCIQTSSKSNNPIVLLELGVPTTTLISKRNARGYSSYCTRVRTYIVTMLRIALFCPCQCGLCIAMGEKLGILTHLG